MKGRLDKEVQKIGFKKVLIVRPSFLKGKRTEYRTWESIGIFSSGLFSFIPSIKKYKPIHAQEVAQAMINGLNNPESKTIYEGEEIFKLS